MSDKRFARLATDPIFKKPKRDDAKVVVDDRFAAMLSSKEFGIDTGPSIDKYGRKKKMSTQKELKRFYKLDKKDDKKVGKHGEAKAAAWSVTPNSSPKKIKDLIGKSESKDVNDEDHRTINSAESTDDKENIIDQIGSQSDVEFVHSDNVLESDDEEKVIDLARGEGLVESSDEEDVEVEMESDLDGPYNDEEIPMGDETNRLAVVNMDWDNIKAKDLYKVFEAFKPKTGTIRNVTVYLSDFGRERMESEAMMGPPAAIFHNNSNEMDDDLSQDEDDEKISERLIQDDDGKEFNMVQLRKYQLERLRFVPNDTTFDDPTEIAIDAPVSYTPSDFITQALQHSNVKLTWDTEDPERTRITRRKFTKDDLANMDFKAYLASESDEELSGDEEMKEKYRALIGGDDEEKDLDMEITFTPGLAAKAERLMEEKKDKDSQQDETVFEAFLRKRKEKKKSRKDLKKEQEEEEETSESDAANGDDPFFQEDFGPEFEKQPKTKTDKSPKLTKQERLAAKADADKSKAELELLLLDPNELQSKHFTMKDVLKSEKPAKRKHGKKIIKIQGETQDDFTLDLEDDRFKSIVSSHHMAIDPTNPQFKHTKSMDRILAQRRNVTVQKEEIVVPKDNLETLVASVKRKTAMSGGQGKRQKK